MPFETTPSGESPSESSADDAPAIGSRSGDAVGMSGIETKGYALIGPIGHHYIFGNLAVADYIDRGQRRIVTLEQEVNLPKDDPNFLYYRELRDGNRWAIATKAGPDRRYAIYFQAANSRGDAGTSWRRMQRAQLQWSRRAAPMEESMVME
jgi:hypothetical protein